MDFDIYRCTTYTEMARLQFELRKKGKNKVSPKEYKELCETARANAMSLIGMENVPTKAKKGYAYLNKLFASEMMKSERIVDIQFRNISKEDLVPILVNARIKALEEYAKKPKKEDKLRDDKKMQKYLRSFEEEPKR